MSREISLTTIAMIVVLLVALAVFIYFAFFVRSSAAEGITGVAKGIKDLIGGFTG